MESFNFLDLLELHLEEKGYYTRRIRSPCFTSNFEPIMMLQINNCCAFEPHPDYPNFPGPGGWKAYDYKEFDYPSFFVHKSDIYYMSGRAELFVDVQTLYFAKVEDPYCLQKIMDKLYEANHSSWALVGPNQECCGS